MMKMKHFARLSLIVVLMLGIGATLKAVDVKYPWLWMYAADKFRPQEVRSAAGPTHVMFTFVDHFEPHDQATMDIWMRDYPAMADRHHDADGKVPQHSWFWYFSYADGPTALS